MKKSSTLTKDMQSMKAHKLTLDQVSITDNSFTFYDFIYLKNDYIPLKLDCKQVEIVMVSKN